MVTPPNMAELQKEVQPSSEDDQTSKQVDETPLPVTSRTGSRDETVSPDSSSGLGSSKQSESNIPYQNEPMVNILHSRNISMEELRVILNAVMDNSLRSYTETIQSQFDEKVSSINNSIKNLESAVSDVSENVASIMQNISGTKVQNRRVAGLKRADSLTSSSLPSISESNNSRNSPCSVETSTPISQNSSRSQSTNELNTATSEGNLTQSVSSLAVQSYTAFPIKVRRYLLFESL